MLPRQARRSVSLHRALNLRSTNISIRAADLPASAAPCVRRYVTSRQVWPGQRPAPADSRRLGHLLHERSLATAVDDYKFASSPYGPAGGHNAPMFSSAPPRSYDFQIYDNDVPLVVETGPPSMIGQRTSASGIPPEKGDMLQVFDICLKVGKIDRAALILKRALNTDLLSPEENIVLNNRYLRAALLHLRKNPDRREAESLHKWYELHVRTRGVPQTAETVACMLKISLLSERGVRLKRLITRYMGMAPGEAGLQVLRMDDILTDQDLAVITEICPTYNFVADVEEDMMDEFETGEEAEVLSATESQSNETLNHSAATLLPTPQRGYGLETLRQGMDLMAELQNVDLSQMSESDRQNIQMRLEEDSISSAINKWRRDNEKLQKVGINSALSSSSNPDSLSQHIAGFLPALEAKIVEELELAQQAEAKVKKTPLELDRCVYGPFLRRCDPSRLAAMTILGVLNHGTTTQTDSGLVLIRVVKSVAKLVHEDILAMDKEKEAKEKKKRRKMRQVNYNASAEQPEGSAEATPGLVPEPDASVLDLASETTNYGWSLPLELRIGSILVKMLIETARIKVTRRHPVTKEMVAQYQPAFTHKLSPRKGKKVGVILLNPHLVELMTKEPPGDYLAKHLPMIVEPKPWKAFDSGGFLNSKTSVVRIKSGDVEQRLYTKEAIKRGDMDQIFKALDVLGKTAWRINNNVLNVMIEAWNTGEEIANFPPLHPDLPMPPEPESSDDPVIRMRWVREVASIENQRAAYHSQRCFTNLQLEVARTFRNQVIYFPHNLDYRGRAYPIPVYLNHMGSDHCRGILKFANGKMLGARGLRWLKIHLSNLYGLDKASFDEREAFATQNMDNIIDSATNPMTGTRWWLEAEDPWQCLAACFELKAAHELADPTQYVCSLPIHQDGTCNGLQHYAALGGDSAGARQVNLEPASRPADVYSAVAELVRAAIKRDMETGHSIAEALDGKVTRKVVKQTVMTNVYGVTFAGAKKQVARQLDDLYPDLPKQAGVSNILLATYVAKHIFAALASMFGGAHDIQNWLGEVGGRVCRALTSSQIEEIEKDTDNTVVQVPKGKGTGFGPLVEQFSSSIVWTTPLRMTIAQPYRKDDVKEIKTPLQIFRYSLSDSTCPVNKRKQLQGFPPNFIHSLDASHMLLSALKCNELGLDFAAVHDSFWTHASDIDTMNRVLRDAFIRIHEEDVVGRLASEFKARHGSSLYLETIKGDSDVAMKIKQLRSASKLTPKQELLLEHKRQTLLRSGNPWDIEAAKKIVTPASIFEDMSAREKQLVIKEPTPAEGLGVTGSTSESLSTNDGIDLAEHNNHAADADLAAYEPVDESLDEDEERTVIKDGTQFLEDMQRKGSTSAKYTTTPIHLWLPMSIPPIPAKGGFDVSRLRDSKYFFS
ncbi:DNA-dependent RNA polymerase [Stachybotrys elegans]|uniref:DNA-directed RNA polymerase n=1 Tax=Stachybotrys elegans TaxID=80388 RepID=A0A8K0WV36_9HYPO|nr:DNA-dependent RNA polymerase [Stachybotrys elegans]